MSKEPLDPDKALIFRIVHRNNMEDVLANGCQCRSDATSHRYVEIGNQELIERRTGRPIPCAPGGTLGDYVPFYFTPYSPMLYNITTGYSGVPKRPASEIVILVSSLRRPKSMGIQFVFSDRHAYLKTALFYSDLADLHRINWPALQERNFRKDDLNRFEQYQAEALVFRHVPLAALMRVVCYDQTVPSSVKDHAAAKHLDWNIIARPEWYL
jgi:ssDNA thymidine ADP-ribosyltransferase, DarT